MQKVKDSAQIGGQALVGDAGLSLELEVGVCARAGGVRAVFNYSPSI
jgi:hypothetical protein